MLDVAFWQTNITLGIARRKGEIQNLTHLSDFLEKHALEIRQIVHSWCSTKKNLLEHCRPELDYFLSDDALYFDLKFGALQKQLYALAYSNGLAMLPKVDKCKSEEDVTNNSIARHAAEILESVIVNLASDYIQEYVKMLSEK